MMRTLVLAIGNSSVFGGVCSAQGRLVSFRVPNTSLITLPRHVRGSVDRALVSLRQRLATYPRTREQVAAWLAARS